MQEDGITDFASRPAGLIGREPELARLRTVLETARRGTGGSIVVEGEPGVGKTALLAAAARGAEGFTVLSVTGTQSESALAFGALSALLAPLRDELRAFSAPEGRALRGALGLAEGTFERLACYAGVLGLLSRLATRRPVLVLADDVHWFDAESHEALVFAARRMTNDPVVCWLGARAGIRGGAHGDLPRMTLAGLDVAAASELLAARGRAVAPEVARRIATETDGNALALSELAQTLSDEQLVGTEALPEPLPVGRRLEEAFWQRSLTLTPATRRALLVVASSFTDRLSTIADALGRLSATLDDLRAAEDAGLITIELNSVRWRHPLVRSTLYHRARPAARRAAHSALAESAGVSELEGHRVWHRAAASVGANPEVAAELEMVAGDAVRRGAWTTAIRAYTQSAALSADDEQRADRELRAAEHSALVGHFQEAISLIAAALRRSSNVRLRARAERTRAKVALLGGAPGSWAGQLEASAEAVVAEDPAMAALAMLEAVVPYMATGDADGYLRIARRALTLASVPGGAIECAAASVLGSGCLVFGTDVDETRALRQAARDIGSEGLWQAAPEIVGIHALGSAVAEDFGEAQRLFDGIVDSARSTGAVRSLYYPLATRAVVRFRLGRWPAALADAHEAVTLCNEFSDSAMLAYTKGILGLVEAGLGRADSARRLAGECIAEAGSLGCLAIVPWGASGLALEALGRGDGAAAATHLERIDERLLQRVREPGWYGIDAMRIEAHLRAGDRSAAERGLDDLRQGAARSVGVWATAVCERCAGLLTSDDEFEASFEAALAAHASVPMPFERAWTELCFGERLRRARRRSQAREPLKRALETFRQLGARTWLERAERELDATGAHRRAESASPSPWSLLTASETRVVQQIIEGATYDEAAGALFVSPRTVEAHLRQVYRKLGLRSRTELTRLLLRWSVPA